MIKKTKVSPSLSTIQNFITKQINNKIIEKIGVQLDLNLYQWAVLYHVWSENQKQIIPQDISFREIEASFFNDRIKKINATQVEQPGQIIRYPNRNIVNAVITDLKNCDFKVVAKTKLKVERNPEPFYKLPELLKDATTQKIYPKQAVNALQKLIEMEYVVQMSSKSKSAWQSLDSLRETIYHHYGKSYLSKVLTKKVTPNSFIPKTASLTPVKSKKKLTGSKQALYTLIWNRASSSQMAPAVVEYESVLLASQPDEKVFFEACSHIRSFRGFLQIYQEQPLLPMFRKQNFDVIRKGTSFSLEKIASQKKVQHIKTKKISYNSVFEFLDESGFRNDFYYDDLFPVLVDYNLLAETGSSITLSEFGMQIGVILNSTFSRLLEPQYILRIEKECGLIDKGRASLELLKGEVAKLIESNKTLALNPEKQLIHSTPCPECGHEMLIKKGPYGKFWGCSNYPRCKYTKTVKLL